MKKILFCLFMLLIVAGGLHAQYQIQAHLTGFKNGTKFYLKDNGADLLIDSAIMNNGLVQMKGKISGVRNLWFYTTTDRTFYYTNLLIGSDEVSIEGDRADFPRNLKISGSNSQDVANILNVQTKAFWKSRDSVVKILMPLSMGAQNDSIRLIRKPLSKRLKQIDSVIDAITLKFIAAHLNSYASMQELYYQRTKYSKAAFEQLFAKVKVPYRLGLFGQRINTFIQVGDALKPGDDYYAFEALDIKGNKQHLSAIKDKYILIDFTETYCGPCIQAAESLKKIATNYPGQLQIVTFYAESNKQIMQQGLDRDQFTWPTLWDGKGPNSEIVLKYGVEGFPSFIIVDPKGKIVSKIVGYGTDDNGKGNIENEVDKQLQKTK